MPTWIFRRASGGCVGWMSGFAPVSAGVVAGSFAVVAVLRVVGRIGGDGSGRQSGGNEDGPREISKKKVRTGGELGLTRVHGRYRPRTGWKPGIGLGGMPPCFSHATAAMPSTRYSAGARRSDERASATAFLNAGAVTSSRRITGGRECTDRRPPPAVDSQTRAPPGSATRRHTSVRDVRAPAHRRREREAHRRGIEQGRDARRGGEGAPARGRRSRGGR